MNKRCLLFLILVISSLSLFGCANIGLMRHDNPSSGLYGFVTDTPVGPDVASGNTEVSETPVSAPLPGGSGVQTPPGTVGDIEIDSTTTIVSGASDTVNEDPVDTMEDEQVDEQSPGDDCEGYNAYQPKDTDVISLPDLSEVSSIYTPLMYDFLNSCLDWHVPIHRESLNSEFYIMRNLNTPIYIYTDFYAMQEGYTLPPCGGQIVQMEIEPERLKAMEIAITKLPEERVLREGDWELLLLELHSDDGTTGFSSEGTWGGFSTRNFGVIYSYTDGNPRPFLVDGTGWPTSWLRREPYASLLKESGINILDPWWDEWRYMGEYVLAPYNEESTYTITTVLTCINAGMFLCDAGSSTQNQYMHWSDVLKICDKELAYVEGKYTPFTGPINIG